MTKLFDVLIDKKEIFPLWVFSDPHKGKNTSGNKFICFIGGNWPVKLMSADPEQQAYVIQHELKTGKWKVDMLQQDPERKMVGWGFGPTPSLAFRHASYMSGHIQLPAGEPVASTKTIGP